MTNKRLSRMSKKSSVETTVGHGEVRIKISGDFTFDTHKLFRQAYENQPNNEKFIVDLHEVEYMDSSAFGMLLLLLDFAGKKKERLHIVGCSERIKEIFDIMGLQVMMTIM